MHIISELTMASQINTPTPLANEPFHLFNMTNGVPTANIAVLLAPGALVCTHLPAKFDTLDAHSLQAPVSPSPAEAFAILSSMLRLVEGSVLMVIPRNGTVTGAIG